MIMDCHMNLMEIAMKYRELIEYNIDTSGLDDEIYPKLPGVIIYKRESQMKVESLKAPIEHWDVWVRKETGMVTINQPNCMPIEVEITDWDKGSITLRVILAGVKIK